MASTTEVSIAEAIKFYGSLMGTPGITEENNQICNDYIKVLLGAMKPFVDDYVEEAEETIKFREEEKKRIEEEPTNIIAPTGHDLANLKIR